MSFYDRMVVIDSAINGAVERAMAPMADSDPTLPNGSLRIPAERMRFLDETNVQERRIVKAASAATLLVCFIAGSLGGPRFFAVEALGTVLLANALYDFALILRARHLARKDVVHG